MTINVTKTYLPPLAEYNKYLKKIWKSRHVTNHGPFVNELENKLKKYLCVKHLFVVTNGTIALQIAIKALELKNEVITTPFSYVATTSSLVWGGCKPIFADVEPDTLTIDPKEIEKKITKKTTGIVATHIYGNPCDVEKIQTIAKKHKLKIIYDAAHAFGVKYKGKSILNYGDISTLSFHATKLFHAIEGGAVITNNDKLAHKISYLRNFGHKTPESFWGVGINGKMTELHAAMGLCNLPKVKEIIKKRKLICNYYDNKLKNTSIIKPFIREKTEYNYAYYPIIFPDEHLLLQSVKALNKQKIYPRRYFYPSLNKLVYTGKQKCKISENISKNILCLPLSHDITIKEIDFITANIINKTI